MGRRVSGRSSGIDRQVLKDQMEERVAGHLSWAYQKGIPDRRNGSYVRHVLTELGNVILSIPRTRFFSPRGIIAAYARRIREIDHLILTCFLLGLSTRKVGDRPLVHPGRKDQPADREQGGEDTG